MQRDAKGRFINGHQGYWKGKRPSPERRAQLVISGREASTKHGLSNSPTHIVWMAMNERCNNKNHANYARYGGRGIQVCKRWKRFETFLADMGTRPAGMSIERINNSKGYSPKNCIWASPRRQANNRRSNRFIIYRGEKLTVMQLSRKLGVSRYRADKIAYEENKAAIIG